LFSRAAAEIERKSLVRSFADGRCAVADVAAELDRGERLVALLTGRSRSERSDLLDRLCADLPRRGTRVIRIDGAAGEPVDVRRFCHLLIAASSAGAVVGDPAERLASILTAPRAGERSLTLVVEDADALLTDALAFVARLAAASSARPLRMRALLLGSHALRVRLAGVGPVAVKWLDAPPVPRPKPLPTQQRTRGPRLALAAFGCFAGVAVFGTILSSDDDRLSASAVSAFEAPPLPAPPSIAFAIAEAGPTTAPSEPALPPPTTTVGQSVPPHPKGFSSAPLRVRFPSLAPPEGAASLPADVVPEAGEAVSGYAPEPQTITASPSAESVLGPEAELSSTTIAELLVRSNEALLRGDALLARIDALLALRPTEDPAPPDTEQSASLAALLEPTPVPAAATALPAAAVPPLITPAHAEQLPAPVRPEETVVPSATATADDAHPAAEPSTAPIMHTEPSATPVQPAETAVPSTAAAAAVSAAEAAARPQRPPPAGASPAAVAALLARGDALIAVGDVAAARLVYQRTAALDSARAATAAGRTYDPRFLRAIGAIGVVADADAAAAWYRKGAALGDADAAPLLDGLDARASR
jgi:hypothetical protein